MPKRKVERRAGPLVVIGGAEDREEKCEVLSEFVMLAGGRRARLSIISVASDVPNELDGLYDRAFRRLGARDVHALGIRTRGDANGEEAVLSIGWATGVFFTGGDQLHITSLVGGTEMQRLIHQRYERGLVIGGTSAGAAMMSNSMILGGPSDESPKVGCVEIGPGMDLVIGAIIDTHFSQHCPRRSSSSSTNAATARRSRRRRSSTPRR